MFDLKIITVSDKGYKNEREDLSGPTIAKYFKDKFNIREISIVPDEIDLICEILEKSVKEDIELIITTGGTGFSKRDVTPEATLKVIEKRAHGIENAMLLAGLQKTPKAMLSRAVCGVSGKSLIINLPGSPKACIENLDAIKDVIEHAIGIIRNIAGDLNHDK